MRTFEVGLNELCIMIFLQDYGAHGVKCSSVNVIGFHNLIVNATIKRSAY